MTRTNIDFSNGKVIRKIEIYYSNVYVQNELYGLRLFDKNDNQMLSVGNIGGNKKDILLEENERILGIKSISRAPNGQPGAHGDLQFMIYKID
jgi:hypothetical protein